jgi:hypothetical protein
MRLGASEASQNTAVYQWAEHSDSCFESQYYALWLLITPCILPRHPCSGPWNLQHSEQEREECQLWHIVPHYACSYTFSAYESKLLYKHITRLSRFPAHEIFCLSNSFQESLISQDSSDHWLTNSTHSCAIPQDSKNLVFIVSHLWHLEVKAFIFPLRLGSYCVIRFLCIRPRTNLILTTSPRSYLLCFASFSPKFLVF